MKTLKTLLALLFLCCMCSAQDYDSGKTKDNYPHALFVLEASALTAATLQNGRSYTSDHYMDSGIEKPAGSVTKFTLIAIPLGIAAGLGAWKLENNRHKGLRILGHGLMFGAIGAHSVSYFTR